MRKAGSTVVPALDTSVLHSDPVEQPKLSQSYPWRRTLIWVLLILALGGAVRGLRVLRSSFLLPTRGASWIWASNALEEDRSLAFLAASDFEIDATAQDTRLHILADEEYILHLNGIRVGSGIYTSGAALDSYAVDRYLKPGWNRVVVELRSGRGAGGLLMSLFSSDGRKPLAKTDSTWRIFRQPTRGILEGWVHLEGGETPVVWQLPPTGAWGRPHLDGLRPSYLSLRAEPLARGKEGRRSRPATDLPSSEIGPEQDLVFDFGEIVAGYLVLEGLGSSPREFHVGTSRSPRSGWDQSRRVVLMPAQDEWSQAQAGEFRYVFLKGIDQPQVRARVLTIDASFAAIEDRRGRSRPRGVFGLTPPSRLPGR